MACVGRLSFHVLCNDFHRRNITLKLSSLKFQHICHILCNFRVVPIANPQIIRFELTPAPSLPSEKKVFLVEPIKI